MNRKIIAAVLMMGLAATAGMAAEASVSLDLASAYVFRGATFNDGLVLQPGLDVGGFPVVEGLSVGVWANYDIDDYDGAVESGQFSEIDLYAGYDIPLPSELVGLSLGYCEYTYPQGGGDADREVSLGLGLDVILAPSVTVYYGLEGGIKETLYVELGIEHEIAITDDLAVSAAGAVGYVSPEMGDAGFSHYSASLAASYSALSASVTYIGQIDDDVLPDVAMGGPYDVDIVGTVGVGIDF